ncbi:hypothetical protein AB1Y20_017093 [Prymnesium parvum]|uniref:Uncharacterized protein n=1 Tax=Prymnesium parvum TaxID=97485 RepID=A0AB34ICJ8_PRYPA
MKALISPADGIELQIAQPTPTHSGSVLLELTQHGLRVGDDPFGGGGMRISQMVMAAWPSSTRTTLRLQFLHDCVVVTCYDFFLRHGPSERVYVIPRYRLTGVSFARVYLPVQLSRIGVKLLVVGVALLILLLAVRASNDGRSCTIPGVEDSRAIGSDLPCRDFLTVLYVLAIAVPLALLDLIAAQPWLVGLLILLAGLAFAFLLPRAVVPLHVVTLTLHPASTARLTSAPFSVGRVVGLIVLVVGVIVLFSWTNDLAADVASYLFDGVGAAPMPPPSPPSPPAAAHAPPSNSRNLAALAVQIVGGVVLLKLWLRLHRKPHAESHADVATGLSIFMRAPPDRQFITHYVYSCVFGAEAEKLHLLAHLRGSGLLDVMNMKTKFGSGSLSAPGTSGYVGVVT